MTDKPILYVKYTCPFSLKVRLFLLEAGKLDSVELREAKEPGQDEAIRRELDGRVAKVSYPTAMFGSDDFLTESDDIISRFAEMYDVRPQDLPTFKAYVDGPFAQLAGLHRELAGLRDHKD